MKTSCIILLVILVGSLNYGCKKDGHIPPVSVRRDNPVPVTDVFSNTAPRASAGANIFLLELPDNELVLPGAAEDDENNIMTYKWTKISGPNSFTFQNDSFRNTRVSDLEKGVYVFELTVTDLGGLFDKARMQVIVGELPAVTREVVIKNPSWDSWEYSYFIGFKIYDYIPEGSFFKAYIQGENANEWIPALVQNSNANWTGSCEYSLYLNGECWLYVFSWTWKSPDIKIVY